MAEGRFTAGGAYSSDNLEVSEGLYSLRYDSGFPPAEEGQSNTAHFNYGG